MPQFMLILYEAPGDFKTMSPEEIQKVLEKYMAWGERMGAAGKMVGGHKLTEEGGKHLAGPNGKVTVVDGPYTATKEVVGGVYLLRAKDYAEAVEHASSCPHLQYGRIEVRQIDTMGQPDE